MPPINIPKTISLLEELNSEDLWITCNGCNQRIKAKRCVNEIILCCQKCETDEAVSMCYVKKE